MVCRTMLPGSAVTSVNATDVAAGATTLADCLSPQDRWLEVPLTKGCMNPQQQQQPQSQACAWKPPEHHQGVAMMTELPTPALQMQSPPYMVPQGYTVAPAQLQQPVQMQYVQQQQQQQVPFQMLQPMWDAQNFPQQQQATIVYLVPMAPASVPGYQEVYQQPYAVEAPPQEQATASTTQSCTE
eukprot:TRINITY_DN1569_c4_g1_i1.p1 TRINITY_DN1569_c4_g1~~TRINITY_DN1569_c4_g1_i1.p1  ORF type:complete len:184 (-),score=29.80 TRINITY_DN1569_c4_g1_i1:60-611(-)